MIQLEYINIELCSSCKECCHLYKKRLIRSPFLNSDSSTFFEDGIEKYGVRPLGNPLYEEIEYCEFYDPSIGCIIEREKRPIFCRNYTCDKLFQNYKEINKIIVEDRENGMKPTTAVINSINQEVEYTFNDIDLESFKEITSHRFNICKSCENLKWNNDKPYCGDFCCGLLDKIHRIYPLWKSYLSNR